MDIERDFIEFKNSSYIIFETKNYIIFKTENYIIIKIKLHKSNDYDCSTHAQSNPIGVG